MNCTGGSEKFDAAADVQLAVRIKVHHQMRKLGAVLAVPDLRYQLELYGTLKEFVALDGTTYRDVDVMNNSDFALCKLGCGSPGFTELKLEPFKRGQTAYLAITSQKNYSAPSVMSMTSPSVRNVLLLCANSAENNGSVFWRIELDIQNRSTDGMMAHWVEAVRRDNSSHDTDTVVFSAWAYSSYVDFSGVVNVKNASIQFRVASFNGSGYIGDVVKSQWYSEYQLVGGNYIEMMIAEEMWRDELAAARVLFKYSRTSSCSLVLSYNSHMGIEQRMDFVMDRSRGFLLDRLAFDHPYTLRLWHFGAATTAAYSSYEFRTSTCLKMVNDPTLCAPPPVSDISWTWDSTEQDRNRVVVTWIYGSPTQMIEDGTRVERHDSIVPVVTTFPRMVHFDIAINPLVTVSQYQCQFLDGQRRVVTWTHRSVVIYVPNEHCNYGIEITVVDSRNRRSVTTKTQVIRYEEKYQMLLPPNGWNTGLVLSLLFEPCNGGTLSCFLNDARRSLCNRTVIDMPSHDYQVHFLAYHLHRFAFNIAQALAYLHDQHCIHLHITAENVYLALDYSDPLEIPCDQSVKLGDFCWATVPHVKCSRILSPQSFLPPEGIISDDDYTTAVDVWQYGLLLAGMVTLNSAKPLLCLQTDIVFTDRLIKNFYTSLSSGIRQFDPYVSSLKSKILMCLSSTTRNRSTMRRIEKEIISLNFSAPVSMAGTSSVLL
ncbi:unnamed protein product [Angiostrongylus costaricensis]|uniref:non-specific serine/threonine protein kinase n=1 Tax=Angiostrongylus costaricensis TaxID=334426 RepID=A0A158PJ71_ANGCS|nr:unnamed protein product [Angiostrongylus costaricensis]